MTRWRPSTRLRGILPFLAAFLPVLPATAANVLSTGHVDHAFRYTNGSWDIAIAGDLQDFEPDQNVLAVLDQPFPSAGGRVARPSGEQWDFLGVSEGEALWLFPQASTPFLWPGWSSVGSFAEHFNDDPRLNFSAPFVKVTLAQVSYSGTGSGHAALWTNQTGGLLTPWIASADGLSGDDAYYFSSGHAHANLGFSAPGVYRLDFQASAFLSNDNASPPVGTNPVTSPVQGFYYAVGTYAVWKAGFFEPAELIDPDPTDDTPEVAHHQSDTDRDGVPLLLEYAFNLSPTESNGLALEPDTGTSGLPIGTLDRSGTTPTLMLEFVRRKAEGVPRLRYHAEFSSDPTTGWIESPDESVEPIDETWERVRVMDSDGGDAALRLGRVRVVLE